MNRADLEDSIMEGLEVEGPQSAWEIYIWVSKRWTVPFYKVVKALHTMNRNGFVVRTDCVERRKFSPWGKWEINK